MKFQLQRQITVAIENQPGRLAAISHALASSGIKSEDLSILDQHAGLFPERQRCDERRAVGPAFDRVASNRSGKSPLRRPRSAMGSCSSAVRNICSASVHDENIIEADDACLFLNSRPFAHSTKRGG